MVAMGLSDFHKKQQSETDGKILDWMNDFSIIEPELVWIYSQNGRNDDVKTRAYWINGISKGTRIHKETIRKSLERLIEQELIWEWPNTKNTRIFQCCFKDWKRHLKQSIKYGSTVSIKIPRGDPLKREKKRRKRLL